MQSVWNKIFHFFFQIMKGIILENEIYSAFYHTQNNCTKMMEVRKNTNIEKSLFAVIYFHFFKLFFLRQVFLLWSQLQYWLYHSWYLQKVCEGFGKIFRNSLLILMSLYDICVNALHTSFIEILNLFLTLLSEYFFRFSFKKRLLITVYLRVYLEQFKFSLSLE